MSLCEADAKTLAAFASARETHPELESLLAFYETLHRAQFEAKAELGWDVDVTPEPICHERVAAGEIQLRFDQLHVATTRFVKLVRKMSYIILENSPGWELPSEPIDSDILADIARRWFESGKPVIDNGPPTTLVSLAVGFALSPYLQKAAEILLPLIDMNDWQRNICPICGGKPGFAILDRETSNRSLFCTRCHSLWAYRRTTCPFCEKDEDIVYFTSEDQAYRLYVCRSCNHYLKTMDLRRTEREAILPVERVLTVSMDLGAQQEGHIYC
jgi:hypothetical protein